MNATPDVAQAAAAFAALFPEIYRHLHARQARHGPRPTLQTMAILEHLALAGPLTVTEAARHLGRAQSVISEIVDQLETKGLLSRMPDSRDRRRHLVWLTEAGQALIQQEREVLSMERLTAAMALLPAARRRDLVQGMEALADAARSLSKVSNRRRE